MLDKLSRYWFIGSTLAIAILVFMYNKRGQKLATLLYRARTRAINDKLKTAKEKLKGDKANYKTNLDKYNAIKRRYLSYAKHLG